MSILSSLKYKPWFNRLVNVLFVLAVLAVLVPLVMLPAIRVKPAFYHTILSEEQKAETRAILVQKSRDAIEKFNEPVVKAGEAVVKSSQSKNKNPADEEIDLDAIPQKQHWQTELTEEEINGYLAIEVPKQLPQLFSNGIKNPRVSLQNDKLEIACQIEQGMVSGVLDLGIDIQFPRPNRVVILFQKAYVGVVPFSRETVRDTFAEGLRGGGRKLEATEVQGYPALAIDLGNDLKNQDFSLILREIRPTNGSLSISGAVR